MAVRPVIPAGRSVRRSRSDGELLGNTGLRFAHRAIPFTVCRDAVTLASRLVPPPPSRATRPSSPDPDEIQMACTELHYPIKVGRKSGCRPTFQLVTGDGRSQASPRLLPGWERRQEGVLHGTSCDQANLRCWSRRYA